MMKTIFSYLAYKLASSPTFPSLSSLAVSLGSCTIFMSSLTTLGTEATRDGSKLAFDASTTSSPQPSASPPDDRHAINHPRTTRNRKFPDNGYGSKTPQTTGPGFTPNDKYGLGNLDGAVPNSATSVNSAATSPSTVSPAVPTVKTSHKSSTPSTAALAGGVSSGVLLFAVFVFLFLRRRRHRHSRHLRIPPELDPEPFAHIISAYTIHPPEQSAAAEVRAELPGANAVERKTWRDGFVRHGTSTLRSSVAPTSSQNTREKHSARLVPPGEETVLAANISQQENTREALLEQEVVALRMRIRAMENLNSEGPGRDHASVSESEAPPGYEDV